MFGIFFKNNFDLRRILTDYGFMGYPLRKDFSLTGTTELSFKDTQKFLIISPIIKTNDQFFIEY